jgi:hypothetical protein
MDPCRLDQLSLTPREGLPVSLLAATNSFAAASDISPSGSFAVSGSRSPSE